MSNPVPSSVALSTISGQMAASPVNSNYSAIQTAVNALITALGGGTAGQKLEAVDSTHVQWTYPPGYEYAHNEFTAPVTVSATTEAAATTVATATAVTFDGSTAVKIECFVPYVLGSAGNQDVTFCLYDGASSIGLLGKARAWAAVANPIGVYERKLTPAAAAKTYSLRAFVDANTVTAEAGVGGVGAIVPGFIRITKA